MSREFQDSLHAQARLCVRLIECTKCISQLCTNAEMWTAKYDGKHSISEIFRAIKLQIEMGTFSAREAIIS